MLICKYRLASRLAGKLSDGGIKVVQCRLYYYRETAGPEQDSISCPGEQDFLEKSVSPDTFSWRTDFLPALNDSYTHYSGTTV